MKFTYYDQTVDLFTKEYFPDGYPERIVVSCSGGLDSTALLFLLTTYFPEIEKHIFTAHDVHHPWDSELAQDVIEWICHNVPNHNIVSHDIMPFDDQDPEILKLMAEKLKENPELRKSYSSATHTKGLKPRDPDRPLLVRLAKPHINNINSQLIIEKYNCSRIVTAMTQNPPNKVMEDLGFAYLAETKRNEDRDDVEVFNPYGYAYHPFARVNKLFVKGVFEDHELLDSLAKLTGSCVGDASETEYFTKPCETCFWCQEKHWAFGYY